MDNTHNVQLNVEAKPIILVPETPSLSLIMGSRREISFMRIGDPILSSLVHLLGAAQRKRALSPADKLVIGMPIEQSHPMPECDDSDCFASIERTQEVLKPGSIVEPPAGQELSYVWVKDLGGTVRCGSSLATVKARTPRPRKEFQSWYKPARFYDDPTVTYHLIACTRIVTTPDGLGHRISLMNGKILRRSSGEVRLLLEPEHG